MRDTSNWTMETKPCERCESDFTRPAWRKARFCSSHCKLIGNTFGKSLAGDNHYLWKGSNVSYGALHHWVYRHLGKPKKCEHCGVKGLKRKDGRSAIQYANVSHKYLRDLTDWISLCTPCHGIYDKGYRRSLI